MTEFNSSSESVGKIPHASESFGNVPNDAETFRNIPKASERKASHTLTVREVARMFESGGVARTERSIINWCHPNKLGVCRLDAYFDPNEKKFFVTPQSVELAIKEEQAKGAGNPGYESVGSVPKGAERRRDTDESPSNGEKENMRELQREIIDLKITNKAKDMFIEQLQQERGEFVQKLMISSHRIGELETKLLQSEGVNNRVGRDGEVLVDGASNKSDAA